MVGHEFLLSFKYQQFYILILADTTLEHTKSSENLTSSSHFRENFPRQAM